MSWLQVASPPSDRCERFGVMARHLEKRHLSGCTARRRKKSTAGGKTKSKSRHRIATEAQRDELAWRSGLNSCPTI